MRPNEVEAVLGHEISHVGNGDMVTMTLVQGIINSFALFLSRIVAFIIASVLSGQKQSEGGGQGALSGGAFYLLTFVFDIAFTLLGSIVVAAFSRWREYRADAGGARLTGKQNMIAALQRLKEGVQAGLPQDNRVPSMNILKINPARSIANLFATHPPIEKRIERLMGMPIK
jgi:heat shock protein HtpX